MATATSTGQYIYRHSKYQKIGKAVDCKIVKRVSRREIDENYDTYMSRGYVARVCECGGYATGTLIVGKYSAAKMCDARCTGATGPACECSCRGINHGGNWG